MKKPFDIVKAMLIAVFVVPAGLMIVGGIYYNTKLPEAREQADKLIINIEDYKKNRLEYPKNLNMMIPQYYKELPKPNASFIRNKFDYILEDEGKNFLLMYNYGVVYSWFGYNSNRKTWESYD